MNKKITWFFWSAVPFKASKQREDNLHNLLPGVPSYNTNCPLYCHINCVCTYTSKNHIERYLKPKRKSEDRPSKRTRHSLDNQSFIFQRDCLFCGEECLEQDKKNPGRWRISYS